MEMTAPSGRNPIDDNRNGLIGKSIDRVDGRLKVTGQATYAYEVQQDTARTAYGFIVEATIAKGRIADIDTTSAEGAPGVLMVMTHKNAPRQGAWGPLEAPNRFARASPQLASDQVRYYGETVAFVVAESFEQARSAAKQVRVRYAQSAGDYEMAGNEAKATKPADTEQGKADSHVGNFEQGFAAAAVKVDATYTTPVHIHAQMEPHATIASWDGDRVTVHCSAQLIDSAQKAVASTLQIAPDKVRIVSRYIGGGFGGKLPVYADVMLSALASRQLQRPVKTALTRQQMFHVTTHRSDTVQRVRLGASADGKLVAIGHDTLSNTARFDNNYENASTQTRTLYAAPNRLTTHRVVQLDLPISDSTRAPGEAVGMLALEQAMDELAEKLGIDPIELRVRNEPTMDPELNIPFSTRQLLRCMKEGAERFGWARRQARPGSVREGRWQIGMGFSTAIRSNLLMDSKCAIALDKQGVLTVRMAMTDIGTGSYTVLSQIAAEMLGLPMERIRMELGDSDFPETPGSGGSWGAASAGSALYDACTNLRAQLARKLGATNAADVRFADGQVSADGKSASIGALAGTVGMKAEGQIKKGDMAKKFSQQGYGAHFAEVAVDMDTGEIRLRRMLGVFTAGRILNMKTATSQATGAMIWGVGSALHEDAVVDPRYGYFVNHDLGEYHVPAHADIPAIEAVFLEEVDDKANPLKIKGVGELGICGAGAAVANAVYNATGVRIREYPLTLDKVLAGRQAQGAARA
ncbi:xanthine dehydrogenase family protein molybdopterin-binding subunit [Variovorax ginsengisoli]|uniref:Xanthine dehydrogenase YagR molybdenum-binding subunit n=1 Tax=Variovorax ginsengisoli TaxID=363844 RepID=A0ABT9S477_9BURK|nr:xanthine dehydrogenase family protein molybdopterin-binding subunit [Variovorax ginsengisoli]MDP9898157.1 xanthine dehydrogenase YagR molybdenum-binding subunit [Variovorax ginsengisoli]